MLKPYMEVLILSVLHVPPEKHPTENGTIAGKLKLHQMIIETKQVLFRAHVHHSTLGLGIDMTIRDRLYSCHNVGIIWRSYW